MSPTAQLNKSEAQQTLSQLDQLKQFTKVVADTGDFESPIAPNRQQDSERGQVQDQSAFDKHADEEGRAQNFQNGLIRNIDFHAMLLALRHHDTHAILYECSVFIPALRAARVVRASGAWHEAVMMTARITLVIIPARLWLAAA